MKTILVTGVGGLTLHSITWYPERLYIDGLVVA